MVTISVSYEDLCNLLDGKTWEIEELDSLLHYAKTEIDTIIDDELKLDIKDSNRPDLWCVEGLARECRGVLGEKGLPQYKVNPSIAEVIVDSRLKNIRPFIGCALVKNISFDDYLIKQFIQYSEKKDNSYGRRREKTSIGLYNWTREGENILIPPIYYKVADPDEVKFIPLGFTKPMTLRKILEVHPKGRDFGHIIADNPYYPLLIDSQGNILSMPPIINSEGTGKVDEYTEEVLVEVTGTDWNAVNCVLDGIVTALAERGGEIYALTLNFPYEINGEKTFITPNLNPLEWEIDVNYASKIIGIKLTPEEVVEYLKIKRYDATHLEGEKIKVLAPAYRADIMHPIDIVEDITIAIGYDKIEPRWNPKMTLGELSFPTKYVDKIRDLTIGLGYQEVLTFSLTNPEHLTTKMLKENREQLIEVANPISINYSVTRNSLLPGLLNFLSKNTHEEYPQRIFEAGEIVQVVNEEIKIKKNLACITIHANASFAEIHGALDTLLQLLGTEYSLEETSHPSFIEGRTGKIKADNTELGIIGEIHPQVVTNWGLELPAAAFEINLGPLIEQAEK
ncbi:MAG: phenylalanine--tRNA ligase subunit beta [Candidatus Wukongarchaeota archaeon]|nr:phenylalanine--tRNA ligase subunit beta [Candidatus Wukongarchaeota archaeon]